MSILPGKIHDEKYSINKLLIMECKSAKMIFNKSLKSKMIILVTLDRPLNLSTKAKLFLCNERTLPVRYMKLILWTYKTI